METPQTKIATITPRQVTYIVVFNHPRPDRTFKTFNEAVDYSEELVRLGFDGVLIRENYACLTSVDSDYRLTTNQNKNEH